MFADPQVITVGANPALNLARRIRTNGQTQYVKHTDAGGHYIMDIRPSDRTVVVNGVESRKSNVRLEFQAHPDADGNPGPRQVINLTCEWPDGHDEAFCLDLFTAVTDMFRDASNFSKWWNLEN